MKLLAIKTGPEEGQHPINKDVGWLNALVNVNEFVQQGLKLSPGDARFGMNTTTLGMNLVELIRINLQGLVIQVKMNT